MSNRLSTGIVHRSLVPVQQRFRRSQWTFVGQDLVYGDSPRQWSVETLRCPQSVRMEANNGDTRVRPSVNVFLVSMSFSGHRYPNCCLSSAILRFAVIAPNTSVMSLFHICIFVSVFPRFTPSYRSIYDDLKYVSLVMCLKY